LPVAVLINAVDLAEAIQVVIFGCSTRSTTNAISNKAIVPIKSLNLIVPGAILGRVLRHHLLHQHNAAGLVSVARQSNAKDRIIQAGNALLLKI